MRIVIKRKNINKVKIDAMTSVRMIIGNLTFKELNSIYTSYVNSYKSLISSLLRAKIDKRFEPIK